MDIFKGWVLKDHVKTLNAETAPVFIRYGEDREAALRGFNEAVTLRKLPPEENREITLYYDGCFMAEAKTAEWYSFGMFKKEQEEPGP